MTICAGLAKPVVAAVQGAAVGIGTTMLLHCDLVVRVRGCADSTCRSSISASSPSSGTSALLPALAGYHRAAEYLMLGKPFDAVTARDIGPGQTPSCHPHQLLATALAAARRAGRETRSSLRLVKTLMKRGGVPPLESAMHDEHRLFLERARISEAREAFAAFSRNGNLTSRSSVDPRRVLPAGRTLTAPGATRRGRVARELTVAGPTVSAGGRESASCLGGRAPLRSRWLKAVDAPRS